METKYSPGQSLKFMVIKSTAPILGILKQREWVCFGAQVSDMLIATKLRENTALVLSPMSLTQQ